MNSVFWVDEEKGITGIKGTVVSNGQDTGRETRVLGKGEAMVFERNGFRAVFVAPELNSYLIDFPFTGNILQVWKCNERRQLVCIWAVEVPVMVDASGTTLTAEMILEAARRAVEGR